MKFRLLKAWEWLRSSFWFIPVLMALGALALAVALLVLDQNVSYRSLRGFWWIFSGGAEGARAVLSSITGSMISVVSITFSLTMVVLSLTASQFGPRLLRNFIEDRRTQMALGGFIGTFVYCLMVLRTIRGTDETEFVPYISVTAGFALALLSVGVFIFFIHHVMTFIQAPNVITNAHDDLLRCIEHLYPDRIGLGRQDAERLVGRRDADLTEEAEPVAASGTGYIQGIDPDSLMEAATEHDVTVRMLTRPGDYVVEGTECAVVMPAGHANDALAKKINGALALGGRRTPTQDIRYGFDQLIEIAMFALSSGINDPHTALTCLDRIGSALCHLAVREIPSSHRYDNDGRLRVIAEPVTFVQVTNAVFSEVRQNAGHNASVVLRMLKTLGLISTCVRRPEDHKALWEHARMVREASRETLPVEMDQQETEEQYQETLSTLRRTAPGEMDPPGD